MNKLPRERNRPYDTSEPDRLGDVLSRLFATRGYGRVQGDRQLQVAWRQVAGEEIARHCRVLTFRNGVLQIGVANGALLSELASFQKQEFLAKFETDFSQLRIRDLKFKLRGHLTSES